MCKVSTCKMCSVDQINYNKHVECRMSNGERKEGRMKMKDWLVYGMVYLNEASGLC